MTALWRALVDVYNWLVPLAAINILWFLLSLTVMAFPGATAALFEVALEVERGHSPAIGDYLNATRRWLLRAWVWGVAVLLIVFVSAVALYFYGGLRGIPAGILLGLSVAIAGLGWTTLFYFWPYMLMLEAPSARRAFRNALFTALASPLYALFYAGLGAVLLGISMVVVLPLPVITPVLVAFLSVYSLKAWLARKGLLPAAPSGDESVEG